MAMFDIQDSEDVEIKDCHTEAETLISGSKLDRLSVEGSSAGATTSLNPRKSLVSVAVGCLLRYGWELFSAVTVAVIVAIAVKSF